MDPQGYPDDTELETIETWPVGKYRELMEFVRERWKYNGWNILKANDDFGRPVTLYTMATSGWSGNESLIAAMQQNHVFWSCCWTLSKRGGYYEFQVRRESEVDNG